MKQRIFLSAVYVYITLPIIVFLSGWLRPVLGIPAALLVAASCALIVLRTMRQDSNTESTEFVFKPKVIAAIILISCAWCFFAGIGGFYYQSDDHWARNAIFRDLIFFDWPVRYNSFDAMLDYYIGHWLLPSLFGKIAFLLAHNQSTAYLVGRIFLFIWTAAGVSVCFIRLLAFLACSTKREVVSGILFFVLFSGLDIIGGLLFGIKNFFHLEHWAYGGNQYSSITTCLFWVYNQAIPGWIATLLLLRDRHRVENFAYSGLCVLIACPFPLVGLFPLYAFFCISELQNAAAGERIAFFKRVLSPQNLVAVLVIFPVLLAYYSSNSILHLDSYPAQNVVAENAENSTAIEENVQSDMISKTSAEQAPSVLKIIKKVIRVSVSFFMFEFLEFGLYAVLVFRRNRRNALFYLIFAELILIPFVHIGESVDFCMRASIPPVIVLLTFVYREFMATLDVRPVRFTILCIAVAFGALTPLKEFQRGLHFVHINHKIVLPYDTVYSMGNTADGYPSNFLAYNYSNTIFGSYLGKKN